MRPHFFPIKPSGAKSPVQAASSRGAALVTVLCILVLMVTLIVMFLSAVGTERRAASAFGAGASARQLADLAVNIVQGQIHEATSGGITNSWASQPGMIRAFNSQGDLAAAYKLYSAGNMVVGTVSLSEDLPPADWKNSAGLWTDLNDPVRLGYSLDGTTNRSLAYPILDPRATNVIGTVDPVAGFSINASSSVHGGSVASADAAPGNNPAPMPVRWLYVLQNGRLAVPSSQTGGVVSFSGTDVPTASNPIIGRVAFWTDDETCKVNLNTAGEGTYWDTPRMTSTDDVRMAFYQPTRNEWQRYPGHPGTTSLSAVFPWRNLPSTGSGTPSELVDTQARQAREAVRRATEISPVYRFGGSEAGTRAWLKPMGSATEEFFSTSTNSLPRKRLYASVDELLFDDDANPSSATRGSTNRLFQTSLPVAREVLETRRFFLTAHSRAPETSLFNLPRIAIWPVFRLNDTDFVTNRTTAFDRQIARVATINGKPYFFQRENALSTTDLSGIPRNVELLSYLDQLTSRNVPGFGDAFSSKYAQQDRRQLLVSIYDYIRSANLFDEYLYANNITKRGSSAPVDQWAFTRNVRTNFLSTTDNDFDFAPPGHGLVFPSLYKWGNVEYRGFGRFPTVSEFGLHLIATADGTAGTTNNPAPIPAGANSQTIGDWPVWQRSNDPNNNLTLGGIPLNTNEVSVQAMPIVEMFDPMQGFTQISLNGAVRITGLNELLINGMQIFTNNSVTLTFPDMTNPGNRTFDAFAGSGFLGFRYFAAMARTNTNIISRAIRINKNTPIDFTGGPVTIEMLETPSSTNALQTINIDFPSAKWPVPRLLTQASPGYVGTNTADGTDAVQITPRLNQDINRSPYPSYGGLGGSAPLPPEAFWSFRTNGYAAATNAGRLNLLSVLGSSMRWNYMGLPGGQQGSGAHIFENSDVVKTVYPQNGDFRLLTGQSQVAASVWTNSWGENQQLSHMLREAGSTGHVPGFLAQSAYTDTSGLPASNRPSEFRFSDLPTSFNNGRGVPTGDWDTGFSVAPDGPFINKPDEGNAYKGWNELRSDWDTSDYKDYTPYFFKYGRQSGAFATFSSPNRIMPSPGLFGSLPTVLKSGIPWQTLLFRPQAGHPGQNSPGDHLFLDLFWMPVVEPYAISEPFSTAGKINMNYQIMPFTYIERSTGIQAVLVNERLGAVPNAHAAKHKVSSPFRRTFWPNSIESEVRTVGSTRRPLNLPAIMRQFQRRFDSTNIFRSASEICSIHMIPTGEDPEPGSEDSWAATFWANHRLTGENIRERIYTTVYPRVTTKSNTFTVHMRAQALKQAPGGNPAVWDETRGSVAGDYRGSTTLERFIDPNNASIPDYAGGFGAGVAPLDSFYRWRVVQNRQFAP
jgi:uncharacterized protein (TIGR02600 family)